MRALEEKQRVAKEKAEANKRGSKKFAEAEDYENEKFIIREAELETEKTKRLDEKKKKFYEEFKPDFDVDEVPPLE